MRRAISIIVVFQIFLAPGLFSQSGSKPRTAFNLEGQVAATSNGKAVWYNMGGPSVKFNFSKIGFGIGMFPSLKFEDDGPRPIVVPILGVGPQIYFLKDKRMILSFPCYYIATRNSWEITGGIGYVLTKPKA